MLRRDGALEASARYTNPTLSRVVIALAIADDWGDIPGLADKHKPETWDLSQTPIPVLLWLVEAVYSDFAAAFIVPKG
jgi:hypothetical protein